MGGLLGGLVEKLGRIGWRVSRRQKVIGSFSGTISQKVHGRLVDRLVGGLVEGLVGGLKDVFVRGLVGIPPSLHVFYCSLSSK